MIVFVNTYTLCAFAWCKDKKKTILIGYWNFYARKWYVLSNWNIIYIHNKVLFYIFFYKRDINFCLFFKQNSRENHSVELNLFYNT